MSLRTRLKALADAFVRLAEAIEDEGPDSLESRVARLERAAAGRVDPAPPGRRGD